MRLSCGTRPSRASTRNATTSLSAIAASACRAICFRIPSFATGSKPPVSTTRNARSPMRARPTLRSRVRPGRSCTSASRERVRRLNSVDLPTLGRPTSASVGSMALALPFR
jgi:hypothetical protein